MGTFSKHLAAVQSGTVTKSNVIGIRKAMNAYERKASRYSISRTCPEWTGSQVTEIERALDLHRPLVTGELHATADASPSAISLGRLPFAWGSKAARQSNRRISNAARTQRADHEKRMV